MKIKFFNSDLTPESFVNVGKFKGMGVPVVGSVQLVAKCSSQQSTLLRNSLCKQNLQRAS